MASDLAQTNNGPDPTHQAGTIHTSPPLYTTIASFPAGSFLENIAVRRDGTLVVSDMLSASIWYIDPRQDYPQESVELVHRFELEACHDATHGMTDDAHTAEDAVNDGSYASTPAAEAIVESPVEADVFYVTSGIHGKKNTWSIYELDMRSFQPKHGSAPGQSAKITKLVQIPSATWLNGGTALTAGRNSLILMAESYQGVLFAYNIVNREISTWLEHPLLGKITTRPPWPGVNGIKTHEGSVYFTNSDRAILGRINVETSEVTAPIARHVEVLATGCCGDDLCIDDEGNIYVATNPKNTVLRFRDFGVAEKADDGEARKAFYDRRYE